MNWNNIIENLNDYKLKSLKALILFYYYGIKIMIIYQNLILIKIVKK